MSKLKLNTKQEAIQLIDIGLKYILGDLQTLRENRERFPMSFPQILLAFSGMEFLGALFCSKGSYSRKVENYIAKWMPERYNTNEGNTSLGRFLYDSLRSGLVHYGNVKGDIVVDHDENAREHHLSWVDYQGQRRLFIHGYQFASDFEDSVGKVKSAIDSGVLSLDTLLKNGAKLDSELEKSRRRDPIQKVVAAPIFDNRQVRIDEPPLILPSSTEGTTYKARC